MLPFCSHSDINTGNERNVKDNVECMYKCLRPGTPLIFACFVPSSTIGRVGGRPEAARSRHPTKISRHSYITCLATTACSNPGSSTTTFIYPLPPRYVAH